MKSKTSLFSSALISNNMKRFWWTSTLYTIILFLIGPMLLLTLRVNNITDTLSHNSAYIIDRLKSANTLFYVIVPIFLGTMLFRYIQNSKSTTLLHSMPYTRKTLYFSNLLSGIILLAVPTLINTLIMIGIIRFPEFGGLISSLSLWEWFAQSIFIQITLYTLTVMVGMFTGSSIAQIIFTFIINVLPLFFIAALSFLFRGFIYGFIDLSSYYLESASKYIPILQIARTLSEIWLVDLILIIITVTIGLLVYHRRNLETSGDVISSNLIKPVFKYGVTVCTMITGAAYVKAIYNQANPNIFVFIFFALLGYVISEMLLRKSFNILSSYKGFLGFVVVFLIILGFIKYDVFGFERRLPNPADVSSVAFGYSDDVRCLIDTKYYTNRTNGNRFDYSPKILFESQNIKNTVALHKILIEKHNDKGYTDTISIGYKLKNGKYILREYRVNKEALSNYFNTIYNSYEYKKLVFGVLNMDVSKIKNLYVRDAIYAPTSRGLLDQKQIVQMLALVKQHIKNTPYELLTSSASPIYNIDFMYQTDNMNDIYYAPEKMGYNNLSVTVNKYGTSIIREFAVLGYDKVLLKPEDFKKIVIRENVSPNNNKYQVRVINGSEVRKMYTDPNINATIVKTITDKAEIKSILDNRGELVNYYSNGKKSYMVNGSDNNGNEFTLGYTDKI